MIILDREQIAEATARAEVVIRDGVFIRAHEAGSLICNDVPNLSAMAVGYLDLRDAVLALHHEYPIYDECSHDDQEACGAWESSDGGIFLCGPVLYVQCAECRCEDCDGKIADYPCPTVEVVARVERGES